MKKITDTIMLITIVFWAFIAGVLNGLMIR